MKLTLSGGHITPALSLAQYALKNGDQVGLIGRRYTDAARTKLSREASLSHQYGLQYHPLDPPKTPRTLGSLISFPHQLVKSIISARQFLCHQTPDVVVSFGGYVGVPLVIAARSLHLPILIHEQTLRPGLANTFAGRLSGHIAVGFKAAASFFPVHKTTYTGNPLRQELFVSAPKPTWLPSSKKPLLFLTGGSQGSQFLSSLLLDSLPRLLPHYQVCLQTGQSRLTPLNPEQLIHRSHLTSKEMAYMLQNAHVIITRAGANTLSECMALGVVAICIPLPHSRAHEQQLNAAYLSKLGQSLTLPQDQANPDTLLSAMHQIETQYSRYQSHAKVTAAAYPQDAVAKIYTLAARLCA